MPGVRLILLLSVMSALAWAAAKVHISTDGASWTTYTISTTNSENLIDLAYGNDRFVSVGVGGTVMVSTDGITWSDYSISDTITLFGVAYGNGVFVAVGSLQFLQNNNTDTYAYYSTDGTSWTRVTLPMEDWVGKISYENGNFYVPGANGIISSSDGITWSTVYTQSNGYYLDITYENGTYLATGYFGRTVTSTDASSWSQDTASSGWLKSNDSYNNKLIIIDGFGTILLSTNGGTSWTTNDVSETVSSLEDVYANSTAYVVVGGSGKILYSSDASNWSVYDTGESDSIGSVTYGDGQFVALQGALVGFGGSVSINSDSDSDNDTNDLNTTDGGSELNVTMNEDSVYAFTLSELNTSASAESLKLVSSVTNGRLLFQSSTLGLNDEVNVSGISSLIFVPDLDEYGGSPYSTMAFQEDNGSGYVDYNYTVNFFVTALNDPVTFSLNTEQLSLSANQSGTVTISYSDPDTSSGSITWSATSSNQTLIPSSDMVFSDSGSDKLLSVTPASGQSGSATITINANDGEWDTTEAFSVSVSSNDQSSDDDIQDEENLTTTFSYELKEGWNLLSLPAHGELTTTDLLSVFNNSAVEKLYKYSDVTEEWQVWCNYYNPDNCSNNLQFSSIHSREGFWVYVNSDVNLQLTYETQSVTDSDTEYADDVPSVFAAWTLGGANRDISAADFAQLIDEKTVNINANRRVRALFKYDNTKGSWEVYSPLSSLAAQIASRYNIFDSFSRTDGIWIRSEEK